ncbi:hypothetical protein DP190_22795 [Enterobacter cloacae]|nr:hypothetical protein DP190_22795 [Enterobacter cloacae]
MIAFEILLSFFSVRLFNSICRRVLKMLMLVISLSIAGQAHSYCTAPNIDLPSTTYEVDNDLPIGAVIGTLQANTVITCDFSDSNTSLDGSWRIYPARFNPADTATSVSGVRSLYPGIGLRWTSKALSNSEQIIWTSKSLTSWDKGAGLGIKHSGQSTVQTTFEFVKTGKITPGTFSSKYYYYSYGTPISNNVDQQLDIVILRPMTFITKSCTVNDTNVNVSLGDYPVSYWTSGNDSSTPQPFEISLTCDANTSVSMKLNGTTAWGSTTVLALDNVANSAKNVGVEISYGDSAVMLNYPLNVGTSPSADSSLYSIPLKARYLNWGMTPTPGVANATATFTLTYQ